MLIAVAVYRHVPAIPAATAALAGIAAVLAVRALITANNFRLATHFPCTAPKTRLGWRNAAGLYFGELHASLASSSWHMPFRQDGPAPTLFAGSTPVLLLHGYGCNSGFWHPLRKRLRAARISHHAIDLEPVFGAIDGYVPQVAQAIEVLCKASGAAQVIIVAHSMGGLVARAAIRKHGGERIAKLITIGTPHAGTGLARSGVGANAREMARDANGVSSNWLSALNAVTVLSPPPLVSIYSRHDNIIAPPSSSHVAGARNIILDGIGHVAMGCHALVATRVIDEILAGGHSTLMAGRS